MGASSTSSLWLLFLLPIWTSDAFNSFLFMHGYKIYHLHQAPTMLVSQVFYDGSYQRRSTALSAGRGGSLFNPYLRNRNSHVKWIEDDLKPFYTYVEEQPLLSHEQEKIYGRAVKMWNQIENERVKLIQEKQMKIQLMRMAEIDREKNESRALKAAVSSSYKRRGPRSPLQQEKEAKSRATYNAKMARNIQVNITDHEIAARLGCSVTTLYRIGRNADKSVERLVNCNLRLVLSIVSRYRAQDIANAELISEGTIGLLRAARKYDYSKGFRFSTYATWYVTQSIADYIRIKKSPAKMPAKYIILQRQVKQYSNEYLAEHGEMPSPSIIARAVKASTFDIKKVLVMQKPIMPMSRPARYSNQMDVSYGGTMMDKYLSYEQETKYESSQKIEDALTQTECKIELERIMRSTLNEAERDIIRIKFGLDNGKHSVTLKDVSRKSGLPFRQLQEIEDQAINKLQESKRVKRLSFKMDHMYAAAAAY